MGNKTEHVRANLLVPAAQVHPQTPNRVTQKLVPLGLHGLHGLNAVTHVVGVGRFALGRAARTVCARVMRKKNSCAMCKLAPTGDRGKSGANVVKIAVEAHKHELDPAYRMKNIAQEPISPKQLANATV